jgi:transcriptional regulator with GAF, ATPase, and Fis domain
MTQAVITVKKNPEVPEETLSSWQHLVDLMARSSDVPAALIMRYDPPQIEVLLSSATEGNPYYKGERADIDMGFYCETVMNKRAPLLVPDALKDPEWAHNPDIKLGMTFYLGYPLMWPNGEIFGTICVLDRKYNNRAIQFLELICALKQMIERDLHLLIERKEILAELHHQRDYHYKILDQKTALREKEKKLQKSRCMLSLEEAVPALGSGEPARIFLREKVKDLTDHRDNRNIIGISIPIQQVMQRVQKVAHLKATVLMTGETGTGKGVFARLIHEKSDRKDKHFVLINCAALPPNLIESELFGREKGAFTGSTARQLGRFEFGDGGTVFLDEIGELPYELQAKLLTVLELGVFERLGSPHPIKVDVRIIASTNRDLAKEVKQGRFRADLFYRLNVFPITIPPLRERRKDISLLAKFFAEKFSRQYMKDIREIPKNSMKFLESYDWPGNVRELMNIIESAVIVSDGPILLLPNKTDDTISSAHQEETTGVEEKFLTKSISEIEREHIQNILKKNGWKVEGLNGAAQLLNIHPSTLKARMRKLGIKRPTAA